MGLVGGLIGACTTAAIGFFLARITTENLPHDTGSTTLLAILAVAVVVGFLAGAATFRRASRDRRRLTLYCALAGAVAGAVVGGTQAVMITAAYLSSYSTWPTDRLDQVLILLAYPAFGLLGAGLGAFCGLCFGWLGGGVIRMVPPAR